METALTRTNEADPSKVWDTTGGIDPKIYARRWLILGVLVLSLVLVVAAVSSVNTAIPSI